jgi:hypothetical protein
MNAREMMVWDMARKNEKQVEALEKETGVNLDHYHKLNITKLTSRSNDLEKVFISTVISTHKVMFCNHP